MTQYISHKPRRANDNNWAMSMAVILVTGVGTLFAIGYFWTRHLEAAQDQRSQQAQFEIYQESTRPTFAPKAVQSTAQDEKRQQAQAMRARLLSHPLVTPKSGFDQPGVQATGSAIVDAIDGVQKSVR